MKKRGLVLVFITVMAMAVGSQSLGRIELSTTLEVPSLMLKNGTLIKGEIFYKQLNDLRPSYLVILEFLTYNEDKVITLPYQAFSEAYSAIEKMADDSPLRQGQGKKTYIYKEFEVGWIQVKDSLGWVIIINEEKPIMIHFYNYNELSDYFMKVDQAIQDYRWNP